jgi:hypothetical protein
MHGREKQLFTEHEQQRRGEGQEVHMPFSYTNRKGVTYTLYRGQTKTGKSRYYFARLDPGQSEPVSELPRGFTISESAGDVISLVKDHRAQILPQEVEALEAAVKGHPEAHRYRVAVKGTRIEVYEQVGPDYNALVSELHIPGLSGLSEELQALEERYTRFTPVLRFILLDQARRLFGVQRMSSLGGIDDWSELGQTGPAAKLARALIPTLGTEKFYELW